MAFAGLYPPGMKLVATWTRFDRGLAIGFLVGALTVGKAMPNAINAIPFPGEGDMPPWQTVLLATSGLGLSASVIAIFFVREGPCAQSGARFSWRHALDPLRYRPLRLATFGYLGHMWELYAMWTWVADQKYVGTALTVRTALGFLLTLLSIRIIPPLVDIMGWEWVFTVLAMGPTFGIWSMVRLRRLPDATRMASGNR